MKFQSNKQKKKVITINIMYIVTLMDKKKTINVLSTNIKT